MSNRFYQKLMLQCGNCGAFRRAAQGYKPIPNPMLFNAEEHCRSYHMEQQRSNLSTEGVLRSGMCSGCRKVHYNWKVIDHQSYLDKKLAPKVS